MDPKKQYAALCCYFGEWPNYFQFWLTSCSYNSSVDFFLVTDISTDGYNVPENVVIVNMTFENLVRRIKETILLTDGKSISCDRPYKLCDFKVAYGHLFRDLFEDYEYWGFYDIDTVWGDIISFIPDNHDNHWLKVFPCGHISFVRNKEPYIEVYRMIEGEGTKNWQTVFSTPENHYFDEHGGLHTFFKSPSKIDYYYRKPDFDNIYPPTKRRWRNFKSINFPECSHYLCYTFEEGHLYRNYLKGLKVHKEEISYLHISKRSMDVKADLDSQRFSIYPNCFDEWREFSAFSLFRYGC